MVNIEDFIKRLEIILDYYNLSASSFADKIGVQRSSLSHLLSGRNKPSLDLILKIVNEFPDVDLYWILNGKGDFPRSESIENNKENEVAPPLLSSIEKKESNNNSILSSDLFSMQESNTEKNRVFETSEEKISNMRFLSNQESTIEIDRIVFFYKDGTFKEYKN